MDKEADAVYNELKSENIEVLYDDRDIAAGEKFAEADLIGLPYRVIISEKSLAKDGAEVKKRNEKESQIVKIEQLSKHVK
jgi:prolyl-tRNA synthetase